jgi:hypothetical protein
MYIQIIGWECHIETVNNIDFYWTNTEDYKCIHIYKLFTIYNRAIN